jgi:exonuclease III
MMNNPQQEKEVLPSTTHTPPAGAHIHSEKVPGQAASADPAFITLLSLNTMKLRDLAGLHSLVRDLHPNIIFLQEVNTTEQELKDLAQSLGYNSFMSLRKQPRRGIAVLADQEANVEEIKPGYLQNLEYQGVQFLHFHAPAGSDGQQEREALFREAKPLINRGQIPPVLVGDFNCVLDRYDTELWDPHKFSKELAAIQKAKEYVDAFRVLHPCEKQFSWHRQKLAASRLDRAYLPKILESSPRTARYIPTTSDHSAFFLRLDTAALGLRFPQQAKSNSFYWKFNSSLTKQEEFLPSFKATWNQLEAIADQHQGGPACWWEEVAKPGIMQFGKFFAKEAASRRKTTRRLVSRALELALERKDWEEVEISRNRLQEMDQEEAKGLGVRAKIPLLEGEVPNVFHLAAEARHGRSPGLEKVKTAEGAVLTAPAEVEQEVKG